MVTLSSIQGKLQSAKISTISLIGGGAASRPCRQGRRRQARPPELATVQSTASSTTRSSVVGSASGVGGGAPWSGVRWDGRVRWTSPAVGGKGARGAWPWWGTSASRGGAARSGVRRSAADVLAQARRDEGSSLAERHPRLSSTISTAAGAGRWRAVELDPGRRRRGRDGSSCRGGTRTGSSCSSCFGFFFVFDVAIIVYLCCNKFLVCCNRFSFMLQIIMHMLYLCF
jgi:hypothetical protein